MRVCSLPPFPSIAGPHARRRARVAAITLSLGTSSTSYARGGASLRTFAFAVGFSGAARTADPTRRDFSSGSPHSNTGVSSTPSLFTRGRRYARVKSLHAESPTIPKCLSRCTRATRGSSPSTFLWCWCGCGMSTTRRAARSRCDNAAAGRVAVAAGVRREQPIDLRTLAREPTGIALVIGTVNVDDEEHHLRREVEQALARESARDRRMAVRPKMAIFRKRRRARNIERRVRHRAALVVFCRRCNRHPRRAGAWITADPLLRDGNQRRRHSAPPILRREDRGGGSPSDDGAPRADRRTRVRRARWRCVRVWRDRGVVHERRFHLRHHWRCRNRPTRFGAVTHSIISRSRAPSCEVWSRVRS